MKFKKGFMERKKSYLKKNYFQPKKKKVFMFYLTEIILSIVSAVNTKK